MHRALYIDEFIRSVIFPLEKIDHYHLALTHRVFLEPALDALWETLDSGLERLLALWPTNATEEFTTDAYLGSYDFLTVPWSIRTLIRPLAANEWDRFNYYSNRIRSFRMGHTVHRLPSSLLRYLAESLEQPGAPTTLLPKVRLMDLDMSFENEQISLFFSYFTSSTLREFCLVDRSFGDGVVYHLVESLFTLQPSLTSFTLQAPISIQSSDIRFSLIGSSFHSFISVTVQPVLWSVVKALGTLPHLRHMNLGWCESPPTEVVLPCSWFPALRVVHSQIDILFAILPTLASKPFITEINIFAYALTPSIQPDPFQQLIDIIGSSCPRLQTFRYENSAEWERSNRVHHSFIPLQNCNEMRYFEIKSSENEVPLRTMNMYSSAMPGQSCERCASKQPLVHAQLWKRSKLSKRVALTLKASRSRRTLARKWAIHHGQRGPDKHAFWCSA